MRSSRARIIVAPLVAERASSYSANVRPVLNGGSRYTQRNRPAKLASRATRARRGCRRGRGRFSLVALAVRNARARRTARVSARALSVGSGCERSAYPRVGDPSPVRLRHRARP